MEYVIVVSGILEPISQVMFLAHITNLDFGNVAARAWTTRKKLDAGHKHPYRARMSNVRE